MSDESMRLRHALERLAEACRGITRTLHGGMADRKFSGEDVEALVAFGAALEYAKGELSRGDVIRLGVSPTLAERLKQDGVYVG